MRFSSGQRWAALSVLFALILALGMTVSNTVLVSAVGPEVKAFRVDAPLVQSAIANPLDPEWDKTAATEVNLAAQQFFQPGGSGSVKSVRLRSMHDGQRIAVRVEWDDTTQNSGDQLGNYSDAVAMQWPMIAGTLPFQCMGQDDTYVNIWEWKYAWEVAHQQNVRTYRSSGPGKHIAVDSIQPSAHAVYQNNKWYVVFSRDFLAAPDSNSAVISPGSATTFAVAAWNGGAGDNRMQKEVSSWITATISPTYLGKESEPDLFAQILPFIQTIVFLVASVGLTLIFLRLIRPVKDIPKPAGQQSRVTHK